MNKLKICNCVKFEEESESLTDENIEEKNYADIRISIVLKAVPLLYILYCKKSIAAHKT